MAIFPGQDWISKEQGWKIAGKRLLKITIHHEEIDIEKEGTFYQENQSPLKANQRSIQRNPQPIRRDKVLEEPPRRPIQY